MPLMSLPQPVLYLRDERDVSQACGEPQVEVNSGSLTLIGLDTEWPPFVHNAKTSTLQLGIADGRTYVISLHELRRIPQTLRVLLADQTVAKVGKSIDGDVKRLFTDYKLEVKGAIDLAWRAKELGLVKDARIGFDAMCRKFLGRSLSGKTDIRLSDWSQTPLSPQQLEYAALDALAGAYLMNHFEGAAAAEQVPSRLLANCEMGLASWALVF